MNDHDALSDEMGFLRTPTPEDADLAAFASALRATFVDAPDPARSATLVTELAETARASAVAAETAPRASSAVRRPRRRWALAAQMATAVAAIPLLFAGLAFAGVKLPGIDSAFEKVGIELPNQEADDDTEGTAKDGDSAGSVTGQENSRGKLGHGKDKAKNGKAKGHAKGKGKNGKALGKQGLAPGQTKENGKPDTAGSGSANAGGNAGGNSAGSQGKGSSGTSGGGSSNAGGNGGGGGKNK
jgi:hypothetical protein